ncbi:MAG: hypothetical protein AB1646_15485 [Thermodesulfobacteriota bacterium]
MGYSERLIDELRAVGVIPLGFRAGAPFGFPPESGELVLAVEAAHIAGETEYLAANLEAHATGLKTLLGAESPEWAAFLAVQTDLLRSRRREKYVETGGVNHLILEMISDGQAFADIVNAAVPEKNAIKALYPWPGSYR